MRITSLNLRREGLSEGWSVVATAAETGTKDRGVSIGSSKSHGQEQFPSFTASGSGERQSNGGCGRGHCYGNLGCTGRGRGEQGTL